MSKQSKILKFQDHFQICYARKQQSQSILPDSAEKGKSFHDSNDIFQKVKISKPTRESQFYLSHRQITKSSDFLGFYRMKSLMFPVTQLNRQDLKNFMILGTYDKKIIVGFNKSLKLFCFFDQHAMHQRIRYEYYLNHLDAYGNSSMKLKEWNSLVIQKGGKSIKLISAVKHSYTNYQAIRSFDSQVQTDVFVSKYGFEIEYIKKDMILKIVKIPQILERVLDTKLVINIAHEIILNQNQLPKCFESFIAEISCKSAYKFNDELESSIIKELISNLSICQYPFFCVHGRPTLFTRI